MVITKYLRKTNDIEFSAPKIGDRVRYTWLAVLSTFFMVNPS